VERICAKLTLRKHLQQEIEYCGIGRTIRFIDQQNARLFKRRKKLKIDQVFHMLFPSHGDLHVTFGLLPQIDRKDFPINSVNRLPHCGDGQSHGGFPDPVGTFPHNAATGTKPKKAHTHNFIHADQREILLKHCQLLQFSNKQPMTYGHFTGLKLFVKRVLSIVQNNCEFPRALHKPCQQWRKPGPRRAFILQLFASDDTVDNNANCLCAMQKLCCIRIELYRTNCNQGKFHANLSKFADNRNLPALPALPSEITHNGYVLLNYAITVPN
jgi:hypothetical protein